MLSGRDYVDMWRCAHIILQDEQGAKALPVGEVFCGKENKGGGRDFLEWAFQITNIAKDLGLYERLMKHYAQNDEHRDTPAARRYWKEVRGRGEKPGELVRDGLRIVELKYR